MAPGDTFHIIFIIKGLLWEDIKGHSVYYLGMKPAEGLTYTTEYLYFWLSAVFDQEVSHWQGNCHRRERKTKALCGVRHGSPLNKLYNLC